MSEGLLIRIWADLRAAQTDAPRIKRSTNNTLVLINVNSIQHYPGETDSCPWSITTASTGTRRPTGPSTETRRPSDDRARSAATTPPSPVQGTMLHRQP
jgi:hypothetical protein